MMNYIYVRNDQKFPVGCVAYTPSKKGEMVYAYSVFNPKDKFSKQQARDVAGGRCLARLEGRPVKESGVMTFPLSNSGESLYTRVGMVIDVLRSLAEQPEIPSKFTRRAARLANYLEEQASKKIHNEAGKAVHASERPISCSQ
jgi:hypothetical protein